MAASHFRLCDITQPYSNMQKQNNKFTAIHFNFDFIYIYSSVEKKWFTDYFPMQHFFYGSL